MQYLTCSSCVVAALIAIECVTFNGIGNRDVPQLIRKVGCGNDIVSIAIEEMHVRRLAKVMM